MLHLRTLFVQLYSCSGTTLLKPMHGRTICDPSPPKEFQVLPFKGSCFSVQACCTPESDSLPPPRKASRRAPVGLGGLLPSLAHFLYTGPNLWLYYIHRQRPAPSRSAAGVVPGQGGLRLAGSPLLGAGSRAQPVPRHTAEGRRSCSLGELFSCWMMVREGILLASPWQMFCLRTEYVSRIFPCSQDNFRDKGLFNSAKSWHLFYRMYNCQIFMRLTSEFKHTLVVQRCD